jgi:hypothetical protein
VYREQYYTVQYPSSSTEKPTGRNKYTERAKLKYRLITEHQEILESYQNTYWVVPIPDSTLGGIIFPIPDAELMCDVK